MRGGVLHGAGEGVAGSVVVQDEAGAAANCIEGLIRCQVGSAGFLAARRAATFSARALSTGAMLAAGLAASALGYLLGCHCAAPGVPAVHDAGVIGAAEDHAGAYQGRQGRQGRPGQDSPLHQFPAYHHSTPFVKFP